ncbi:amidase [Pseudomonas purpurea]|uniref:amidase n=1 Tax=Pseudomonas purpurea TaxID=3136737 RepID=UPI0032647DAE
MNVRNALRQLLLVLMVVLLGWIWLKRVELRAFPDILGAYTAKEYCSCRYVARSPADYCRGYVKQYLPISHFVDEASGQRVTVTALGRSSTAAWLGERQGCRLLP